jgi:hypothetical protein
MRIFFKLSCKVSMDMETLKESIGLLVWKREAVTLSTKSIKDLRYGIASEEANY